MKKFLDRLTDWFDGTSRPAPSPRSRSASSTGGGAAAAAAAASRSYPNTFETPDVAVGSDRRAARVPRAELFDPALRQFRNAYRLGDPQLADAGVRRRWQAARRQAASHVLRLITRSPFADGLVLRGSFLMRAWFGDAAREPRDLDWVMQPATIGPRHQWAVDLFDGIRGLVDAQPLTTASADGGGDLVTFHAAAAAVDDIWTYDRVPGRRIVLPWRAGDLPAGVVQIDVVFGEPLHAPPVRRMLPADAGHAQPATLWAADMPQSLAWKLQWLATDQYPQGKDLYDAVLLAERTSLPAAMLRTAIESSGDPYALRNLGPDWPMNWPVQWEEFQQEYGWVDGTLDEWLTRLAAALRPTLAGM